MICCARCSAPARRDTVRAVTFLREAKPQLVASLARDADIDRYTVYQMIRRAIGRSEHLDLWVRGSRRDALRNARWLLRRMIALYSGTESPTISL